MRQDRVVWRDPAPEYLLGQRRAIVGRVVSSPMIVRTPSNPSLRSVTAAHSPASEPPTMTIRSAARLPGILALRLVAAGTEASVGDRPDRARAYRTEHRSRRSSDGLGSYISPSGPLSRNASGARKAHCAYPSHTAKSTRTRMLPPRDEYSTRAASMQASWLAPFSLFSGPHFQWRCGVNQPQDVSKARLVSPAPWRSQERHAYRLADQPGLGLGCVVCLRRIRAAASGCQPPAAEWFAHAHTPSRACPSP